MAVTEASTEAICHSRVTCSLSEQELCWGVHEWPLGTRCGWLQRHQELLLEPFLSSSQVFCHPAQPLVVLPKGIHRSLEAAKCSAPLRPRPHVCVGYLEQGKIKRIKAGIGSLVKPNEGSTHSEGAQQPPRYYFKLLTRQLIGRALKKQKFFN